MISTEGQIQGCSTGQGGESCPQPAAAHPQLPQCRGHIQQQFPHLRMWHLGSCLLEGAGYCPLSPHPPQMFFTQPWTDLNAAFRASPRAGGDTQPPTDRHKYGNRLFRGKKKKPNKDLQNEKTQKQGQGRANWSSVTFQRGQQSKPTPLNKEYIALIITVCLALTFAAVLPKL